MNEEEGAPNHLGERRRVLITITTGHTLVESTVFPHHFNEITLNGHAIDVELTFFAQCVLSFILFTGKPHKSS
jgi:hypothetical protein